MANEKTLIEYLVKGLKATLEESISENNPLTSERIRRINNIWEDVRFYRTQGIPIEDGYLEKMQKQILDMRDKWSI